MKRIIPVETRRIEVRDVIVFTTPLPPPLNNLFGNVAGKGRVKSHRYRQWIKEAGWEVRSQRIGQIFGPVTIAVEITRPHSRRPGDDKEGGMSAPSARGLFRATGKKPKPVVVRDLITGEYSKSAEGLAREKDDFYPTPVEPTRAGLAAEIQRLRDFPVIWEPACGDGAMVREMETLGLRVARSDLVDRACPGAMLSSFYDFTDSSALSKAIFTNPPFDQCGWGKGKARWLYHAIQTLDVDYMALLLPWSWPGAGGLASFWTAHPPSRVYLMRWKIDFTGQGAPPNLHGWFVWDKASPIPAGGDTPLKMLDRIDARQGDLNLEVA